MIAKGQLHFNIRNICACCCAAFVGCCWESLLPLLLLGVAAYGSSTALLGPFVATICFVMLLFGSLLLLDLFSGLDCWCCSAFTNCSKQSSVLTAILLTSLLLLGLLVAGDATFCFPATACSHLLSSCCSLALQPGQFALVSLYPNCSGCGLRFLGFNFVWLQ